MKKILLLIGLLVTVDARLQAAKAPACTPLETKDIETQARCTEDGGVAIGQNDDESSTFSCLESKTVQNRCGPDGRLARLRAFQSWMKQVKEFEMVCTSNGGTFSYQDPLFREPTDESFCSQAAPEVSSNMFEDTLCNFHSACPTAKVRCEQTCSDPRIAFAD